LDVDDALVKALRDNVKREVAPYKDPRAIEFVEQSPKTESGKSKRFSLR
jgi:acyl-coenzyme A synthetase/AMP-(fatty) acid ligase